MNRVTYSFLAVLVVSSSLLAAGCGDSEESNNGTDVPEYERPEGSKDIISDARLAEMEELGLEIHTGLNPPDVTGTYVFDSSEWVVAPRSQYVGRSVCDSEWAVTVESDGTLSTERTYTSCEGSGMSSGILVSGEGDCFTTYQSGSQTFEECEFDNVTIVSACLSQDGLTDYEAAFYNSGYGQTNCTSLISEGRLPPEEGIVVTEETDGLAAFKN